MSEDIYIFFEGTGSLSGFRVLRFKTMDVEVEKLE